MSDRRQADLRRWHKQGKFTDSELAWLTPIWPEGLALLRLAERGGLSVDDVAVPGVPPSKGGSVVEATGATRPIDHCATVQ
ncbi:MAG: hypothetical protein MUF34_30235 [Polyangiaceae bacterium]|nr:hypothetical protein [Polyangiaceae bacterium]